MCGIAGAWFPKNMELGKILPIILSGEQHRGQDGAGIVVASMETSDRFFERKGDGLVFDIFRRRSDESYLGNCGIGHNRYPTTGICEEVNVQPIKMGRYVDGKFETIFLVHNGNLTSQLTGLAPNQNSPAKAGSFGIG